MKKKIVALAAAAVMVVGALAGCGGSGLTFATGGESGTYYAVGGVIANDVTNNTDVKVTAVAGNGSKNNVIAIQEGEAQLAFCQSDVLSYAYNGTNLFAEEGAVQDFSIVAVLYDETVQIVTCDPSIKTVADLKGKNVSIGAAGSGVYFNAIDILGAYGLSESDINPTYQDFGDSAAALKDGQIDAAFIVAGAPTTAITELSTGKQAYLVGLDDAHIAKLIAASPFYSKTVLPAGTYSGIDTDTATVSVQAVILAANSVDEETIYTFTAELLNNLDTLAGAHDKFKEMSIEKAASLTGVPYHPGAAKYYAEQGITVE